jgi:hypothetical protein
LHIQTVECALILFVHSLAAKFPLFSTRKFRKMLTPPSARTFARIRTEMKDRVVAAGGDIAGRSSQLRTQRRWFNEHRHAAGKTQDEYKRGGYLMTERKLVVVAGLGEVGRPLLHILSNRFDCAGIDVEPVILENPCSVLHICYPFQIGGFVGVTAEYVHRLRPDLTIIHSTVPPGTTREVETALGDSLLAYSPVRGKHAHMEHDMTHYRKFVAAIRSDSLQAAREHLTQAGFRTATFPSPELAELAKLLETTSLGMLIAWAQEMERLAAVYGGAFKDVNAYMEEVAFLPSHIFPGVIGGHCVMPNIELLKSRLESQFLDLVVESNLLKSRMAANTEGDISYENRTDRIGLLGA